MAMLLGETTFLHPLMHHIRSISSRCSVCDSQTILMEAPRTMLPTCNDSSITRTLDCGITLFLRAMAFTFLIDRHVLVDMVKCVSKAIVEEDSTWSNLGFGGTLEVFANRKTGVKLLILRGCFGHDY